MNATQNHLITYNCKNKMGGTTIFALSKMTTFIVVSGYSYINTPLIPTKKVATLSVNSDHSRLFH